MVRDSRIDALANAVIMQAVDDYKMAAAQLEVVPGDEYAIAMMHDVMNFLYSNWYRMLTKVDPGIIVNHLNAIYDYNQIF